MQWEQVLVDSITARQRAMAFESAQQTRDLMDVAATASEVPNASREFLGCELGLAMGVADSTASAYVTEAIDLFVRCPATFAALEAGAIVPMKASTIRSHTQDLSPEITALVEADVLPTAGRSTMPQLRNRIAKSIIRRDPDGADDRHEKATARRRITTRREEDGMASLWLYGTATDVGAIAECVHALADAATTDGDTRSIGERRVDALVDVCADVLARGTFLDRPIPEQQRRRPQLLITIPATALMNPTGSAGEVADLAGYGPITISQAAAIAADATWRRLVCDPTSGALLDYGRTTYSPPKSLADFVLTRDKTCVTPGCRQPAHRCDIDHREPFHPGQDTGGDTSATNCSVLCRRHHRAKDHGGYRLHRTPGGHYHWTTPLKRTYDREATRLWDPPDTPSPDTILDQLRKQQPRWYDPDEPPPF